MSILDKIRSFEFDRNRTKIFGIKSAIVWAHSKEKSFMFPLLYISKPKNISQEDYEAVLDKLQISILR